MSDFSLKILDHEFTGNLRNCRRFTFGIGNSTCQKIVFFFGLGQFSDAYFLEGSEKKVKLIGQSKLGYHLLFSRLLLAVDLTRKIKLAINLYKFLRMYKGIRFFLSLPCRGQRTKTNASSRKLVSQKKKAKKFKSKIKSNIKLNDSKAKFAFFKYRVFPEYYLFENKLKKMQTFGSNNGANLNLLLDLSFEKQFELDLLDLFETDLVFEDFLFDTPTYSLLEYNYYGRE